MSHKYIRAYEYESNVNPPLQPVPISQKSAYECEYGMTPIDLHEYYNVQCPATSPNLLASFLRLAPQSIYTDFSAQKATSHFFYVLQGSCEADTGNSLYTLSKGDIFITPFFDTLAIENLSSTEDTILYYINDSPLLHYLGSIPSRPTFQAAIYSHEFIQTQLKELANPLNNRKGILLSNVDTEKIGVNTITPVLWSLYNELPPHTHQRPHRHNSVALDLCITSEDPENIYTLVGERLDEEGNIVNPTRVPWNSSEMFITPPWLWHSHHNEGDTYAYILPIQDAGLLLYQRILGIELR